MASVSWQIRFMAKNYVELPAPFHNGAGVTAEPAAFMYCLLGGSRQGVYPPGQPGNLSGSVFLVDGSLDGGPAQHRTGLLQGSPQGFGIAVLIDGGLNALDGIFHPGFNNPVTGPALKALTMSLDG